MMGETENFARWREALHSFPEKGAERNIAGRKGAISRKILEDRRHVTPSVHQFLSESLADFLLGQSRML